VIFGTGRSHLLAGKVTIFLTRKKKGRGGRGPMGGECSVYSSDRKGAASFPGTEEMGFLNTYLGTVKFSLMCGTRKKA